MLKLTDEQIDGPFARREAGLATRSSGGRLVRALYRAFPRVEGRGDRLRRGARPVPHSPAAVAGHGRRARPEAGGWGDAALCATAGTGSRRSPARSASPGLALPAPLESLGPRSRACLRGVVQGCRRGEPVLSANYAEHQEETLGFANALGASSLGPELGEAWSAQLSTLVKCTGGPATAGSPSGRLGCCGFQTMDVSYQGTESSSPFSPSCSSARWR